MDYLPTCSTRPTTVPFLISTASPSRRGSETSSSVDSSPTRLESGSNRSPLYLSPSEIRTDRISPRKKSIRLFSPTFPITNGVSPPGSDPGAFATSFPSRYSRVSCSVNTAATCDQRFGGTTAVEFTIPRTYSTERTEPHMAMPIPNRPEISLPIIN